MLDKLICTRCNKTPQDCECLNPRIHRVTNVCTLCGGSSGYYTETILKAKIRYTWDDEMSSFDPEDLLWVDTRKTCRDCGKSPLGEVGEDLNEIG